MAKVLTFSRTFPSYHPRAGEPTYFVEQVLSTLANIGIFITFNHLLDLNEEKLNDPNSTLCEEDLEWFWYGLNNEDVHGEKLHTIRSGHRWKDGDMASPRVWSGKPYASPQIIFAPDTKVVKTYNYELDACGVPSVNGFYWLAGHDYEGVDPITINDGLSESDFQFWFIPNLDRFRGFEGQIICWKDPEYEGGVK